MNKLRIRLAFWFYSRGAVNLAERIYPGIYWYAVGLGFSNMAKSVRQAMKALGEGWTSESAKVEEG